MNQLFFAFRKPLAHPFWMSGKQGGSQCFMSVCFSSQETFSGSCYPPPPHEQRMAIQFALDAGFCWRVPSSRNQTGNIPRACLFGCGDSQSRRQADVSERPTFTTPASFYNLFLPKESRPPSKIYTRYLGLQLKNPLLALSRPCWE